MSPSSIVSPSNKIALPSNMPSNTMCYLQSTRLREVHGSWDRVDVIPRLSLYRVYENFACYKEDEHCMTASEEGGVVPLPFSCAYSSHSNSQHVVAVANEDGKVHLIDTRRRKGGHVTTWQAHVNAVFDLAWVPGNEKLVTGSGDQTAQLWDVPTSKCISVFKGHTCSLRSISFKVNSQAVFATGARDGNVMTWDTRTRPMKCGYFKPINILHGVHNTAPAGGPAANRRSSVRNTEAQQSVTTVLFKDEHHLYSSGAADGAIKMWDMRRYYTTAKGILQPKHTYPYVGTGTRKHGISSVSLTHSGDRLFSSCTDDNIYMYNTYLDTKDPVAVFSGHTNSTFYVKTCVSRDDQYLISGSSSHSLFVWDINRPHLPPVKLDGHTGEVTSVATSPTDLGQIVSCSDDNTVRIWRLQDQTSLCKEGFKCGTAGRMTSYTPVELSSLNLTERQDETLTTPVRASSRASKITPSRGVRITPGGNHGNTPSTPNSRFAGNRLATVEEQPGTSGEQATSVLDRTPVRAPRSQSPQSSVTQQRTPRGSHVTQQRTPGTIAAYFRSNGMLSAEKRVVEQSPVQQSPIRRSPRINKKGPSRRGGKKVSTLKLDKAADILARKPPTTPSSADTSSKQSKRKEKLKKNTSSNISEDGESTLSRTPVKSELPASSSPSQEPGSSYKLSEDSSSSHTGDNHNTPARVHASTQSEKCVSTCVATQSEDTSTSTGVQTESIGTQTLSPLDCTASCRGCCRSCPPLYSGPKSHTPVSTIGASTCTPSTVATDLTPRSCSNSSIPRPKRIQVHPDIPTTPTKGQARILKLPSPENKENSEHRPRRKFTKTGTPIHRNNCRCKFCMSSATEFSELSNSPILDMPSRPRKRLLSHEYSAETLPKKRKSLFRSNSEVGSDHTMRSCSPCQDSKSGCDEAKPTENGQEITVTQWLGGKIGNDAVSDCKKNGSDGNGDRIGIESRDVKRDPLRDVQSDDSRSRDSRSRKDSRSRDVGSEDNEREDHDHSQCSTLHCIRSYFTKRS